MYKYRPRRGSLDRWGRWPFIQDCGEIQPLQARIPSKTTSKVSGSQADPLRQGWEGPAYGVWLQATNSHPGLGAN